MSRNLNISQKKPHLSIITVCRNEESRIQRTIDSVLQQSDMAFEWIVVDGASTDGTLDILRQHRPSISQLISEPDQGLYDAMNKGVRVAHGEYTLFLNAGDRLENKDVVRSFRESGFTEDLVVGDIQIVLADGRLVYRKSTEHPLDGDLLYWRSFPHPATFIKRRLFQNFGVYDLSFKIAADWEFFTRMVVCQSVTVVAWSYCVAVFTNDGMSSDLKNRRQLCLERNRIRKRNYPILYRWRREGNERWGGVIHWFRVHLWRGAGIR